MAMAPTNAKTVNQTSLLYIESNLDRLEMPSPTHGQRSQQQIERMTLQSLINKPEFFKATHRIEIRKTELPRSMVLAASSWWSRHASQHLAVQSPVHPRKKNTNLAGSPLLVGPLRKKTVHGQRSAFPSEASRFALGFSHTGVQHCPGSSTIELPSAFAESGAYPSDGALLDSP